VLSDLAACFRKMGVGKMRPVQPRLLAEIDEAISDVSAETSSPERELCLWSLAGLRRSLFPRAEPYMPAALSEAAQ
jgi:hypothetical protein